jgi:phosphoglycolate phosphatase
MNKKLILFDIDGTLMYHVGQRPWESQYAEGMKVAYGITKEYKYGSYNGSIERHMAWDVVQKHNISREEFFAKFPLYVEAMLAHLDRWSKKGKVFEPIPEAVTLVEKLHKQGTHMLSILTGNAKSIGWWKLEHTGLASYFTFGLYGEEADDRIALAKLVFEKAKKELGIHIESKDIVVIGDTVHDIRCGKAIGATTVAVTTGMHGDPAVLERENPDILVDSLMDPRVLSLFSLS